MNPLTQAVISGLTMGVVYALLATGLVIVFHTSRIINVAHGESYAIGGIATSILMSHKLPAWVAIIAGIAIALLLAVFLERILLRPRRSWTLNSLILVTLAAAYFVRGVLNVAIGSSPISFPRLFVGPPLRLAGGAMPTQGVALVAIGLSAALAVPWVLARTRLGFQLRAAAENPDAASLMGINVDFVRSTAFAIAGAYGALAAILLVPMVSVDFQTGLGMTMRGFIAAALGGMSPLLSILCAFLLGIGEAFVTTYWGALAKDPIIFLVLIGIALWQSRKIRFSGISRA
jgi:branched-chain amino acid transport system permease protein